MTKKEDSTGFYIMVGIIIAAVIIAPKLKLTTTTEIVTVETTELLENPSDEGECSIEFAKLNLGVGEETTATIIDGVLTTCDVYFKYEDGDWVYADTFMTDVDGTYTITRSAEIAGTYHFAAICDDCVTPSVAVVVEGTPPRCVDTDGEDRYTFGRVRDTVEMTETPDSCLDDDTVIEQICASDDLFASVLLDCPTTHKCEGGLCIIKEGYNLGDVVGGGTEGGTLYGPGAGTYFDLTGVETGGPCRLGARIHTEWDYEDPALCYGMVQQEGVEWKFYDSEHSKWNVVDLTPQTHDVDLCPLVWDGATSWKIEMFKTQQISGCGIMYDWDVEIYVCECD